MERIIMHIDVNNAFLSWTAQDLLAKGYPIDIRKIESIIAGDKERRAGIVLAKSPPAKQKGVKTAETIYSAKRKCKNLKIFPPDYQLYQNQSKKLFKLLSNYTPDIEIASIDECFLDYGKIKKLHKDPLEFAKKIQKEINDTLGFTVKIGIANNKLCAKMASEFKGNDKINTLFEYEIKEKLFPLPIGNLFTVGKQTEEKLKYLGIKTVKDLATKQEYELRKVFKNQAKHLIEIANGIDTSEVNSAKHEPKTISTETTTSKDITNKQDLYKILLPLSETVSKRLRKENQYAWVLGIILKDNKFKRYSHQKKLKNPINSQQDIYKYSKEILEKFYNQTPIRLIGIKLENLTQTTTYQTSLFEKDKKQEEQIDKIMDKINEKYGKEIIKRASLIDKK